MKMQIKRYLFLTLFMMLVFSVQKGMAGYDGHFHPDSLQNITVSGIAIVDDTMMHPMYYLDSDGDGQADYMLNFGPWWYEPDSSEAVRPANGENITIKGGLFDDEMGGLDEIVVYEINNLFWRNPAAATWNMMGNHDNDTGHHNGMGYAFGWMHDSMRTVEVTGFVITDTTFVFTQYYLDINQDSIPEYFLNFGPPWYEPASGIDRPLNGQQVSIIGGLMGGHDIPMVIVFELNGQSWSDSSSFGMHFGGGWIHQDMNDGRYFHSPFDSLDGMYFRPGWHNGNDHGHGGMMSDSLFCQILEVYPQNIPNREGHQILAGYEVAMFNPDGSNNMWMGGMNGGHMNMKSDVDYTLHYNDIQLEGEQIDEASLEAFYWDDRSSSWVKLESAVLDEKNNTVTFTSKEVSNFVILSGQKSVTAIDDINSLQIKGFHLQQNYPNPFNPVTVIRYQLNQSALTTLTIYNTLGQKIAVLVNDYISAGEHSVEFDGRSIPSGTYYYELKVGGNRSVKKMTLLK